MVSELRTCRRKDQDHNRDDNQLLGERLLRVATVSFTVRS